MTRREAKLPINEINTFTSVQAHDLTSQDPTSNGPLTCTKRQMMASSGQQCNSKNLKQFKCPLHMSITYIHTCSCMYCTYVTNTCSHACTHVHSHYMHTDIAYMNAQIHTYTFRYVCAPSAHTYTHCMHTLCAYMHARMCPEALYSVPLHNALSQLPATPLKAVAREL